MKTWMCLVCGWVYDEEQGWPEDGIAPGTKWEDVPSDWICPEWSIKANLMFVPPMSMLK